MIAGLPEWAWKYSSLDYVSAGGVPLPAVCSPGPTSMYEDLKYLQYAGNEGMHAEARLRSVRRRLERGPLMEATLRVSISLLVWCRKAYMERLRVVGPAMPRPAESGGFSGEWTPQAF